MSTTTEASREELVAEYVARNALELVHNRIHLLLEGGDEDVLACFPENTSNLVNDLRLDELFTMLWSGVDEERILEGELAGKDCYLAARILRAIVYHAEQLRADADYLFEHAARTRDATNPKAMVGRRGLR